MTLRSFTRYLLLLCSPGELYSGVATFLLWADFLDCPRRLVVFSVMIGQPHFGHGSLIGGFQVAYLQSG